MKNNGVVSWVGSIISGTFAVATEVAPTAWEVKFAAMMAGISAGVTILYTIWAWYKKATSPDGEGGQKITPNEIKEGIDEVFGKVKKEDGDKN